MVARDFPHEAFEWEQKSNLGHFIIAALSTGGAIDRADGAADGTRHSRDVTTAAFVRNVHLEHTAHLRCCVTVQVSAGPDRRRLRATRKDVRNESRFNADSNNSIGRPPGTSETPVNI